MNQYEKILLVSLGLFSSAICFFFSEPLGTFIWLTLNVLEIYFVFLLLAFNKVFFRILFYFLFFLNALSLFYYLNYHILLHFSVFLVALDNLGAASAFSSLDLFVYVVLVAILLPICLDVFYLRKKLSFQKGSYKKRFNKLNIGLFVFFCLFVNLHKEKSKEQLGYSRYLAYKTREEIKGYLLFPQNIFMNIKERMSYINNPMFTKYEEMTNVKNYSLSKEFKTKSQTVVFTFGESLDASHLGVNGYKRTTTPLLEKQKNIIFLKKTKSCATYTGEAHPCMTKPFDTIAQKKIRPLSEDRKIHSIVSIFKKNGFKVFYLGLPNLEKSLKIFQSEFNLSNIFYVDDATSEEAMKEFLEKFKMVLQDKAPKKVIFLATRGNHVNYYQAKGFEKFPVKEEIQDVGDLKGRLKDKNYLYNRYDNSILYVDFFMNKVLSILKKTQQNSLLYFFSDHGENLDNPDFGIHGTPYSNAPYDVVHPAAFLWVSDQWLKNINSKTLDLFKKHKDKKFSYGNIFHSVLDCSGIESKYINKQKSLCYSGK